MEVSPKRQKPEEELVLKSVPTSIPRHVTSLVLRGCGITFIPEVLLECKWLKGIDLSWNQLTKLPEAVGNWTSLKEINLERNNITKLPEAVGNWTSLEKIDIWGNQLIRLPEAVGNWTSLEVISLWGNRLIVLPETVGNWTSLKHIFISQDMKCPKNAKDFLEYYSSRMIRKKEATLLYWALKKCGLPRDLANLGRKAVWAARVKIKYI